MFNKDLKIMMPQLHKDSLILIFQRCFGVVIQISLTFFLTRKISVEDFSRWSFVQSLILIFSLLEFPLVSALQNAFIKHRVDQDEHSSSTLFLAAFQLMFLMAVIFSGVFMIKLYGKNEGFYLTAILFFLSLKSFFQIARAGLFAYDEILPYTVIEMGAASLAACFILGSLETKLTFPSQLIIYTMLFSGGAYIACIYFFLRRKWHWRWVPFFAMKSVLLPLMKPVIVLFWQNIAAILLFSADITLIYYLFDSSEVAQFYLYQRIFNGVLLVTLPITTAAWVRFTTEYQSQNKERLLKILRNISQLSLLIIASIGSLFYFTHHQIVYLLSGHHWESNEYCLAFLVNIFLVTFQSIFSTALNAIGHHEIQAKNYAVLLVMKMAIIFLCRERLEVLHILWITNGVLLPMIGVNLWKLLHILQGKTFSRIQ